MLGTYSMHPLIIHQQSLLLSYTCPTLLNLEACYLSVLEAVQSFWHEVEVGVPF